MKTPFLHLLPPRLARTLRRLKENIWTVSTDALPVAGVPATDEHRPFQAGQQAAFEPIGEYPHYWGRSFQQRWFRIGLAPGDLGEFTHLLWRDRAEATLYLDGVPWGGFDPGHAFVELHRDFSEIHVESICCRTAFWVANETEGIDNWGSLLEGARLARRNESAWQAYHDFLVLWELLEWTAAQDRELQRADLFASPMWVREHWSTINPLVRILVGGLDRAADAYDREGPEALTAALRPFYRQVRGGLAGVKATLTGHAHIDLVWLWPERIGEAKAVHTFANVTGLMRRYPNSFSVTRSPRAIARLSGVPRG